MKWFAKDKSLTDNGQLGKKEKTKRKETQTGHTPTEQDKIRQEINFEEKGIIKEGTAKSRGKENNPETSDANLLKKIICIGKKW